MQGRVEEQPVYNISELVNRLDMAINANLHESDEAYQDAGAQTDLDAIREDQFEADDNFWQVIEQLQMYREQSSLSHDDGRDQIGGHIRPLEAIVKGAEAERLNAQEGIGDTPNARISIFEAMADRDTSSTIGAQREQDTSVFDAYAAQSRASGPVNEREKEPCEQER